MEQVNTMPRTSVFPPGQGRPREDNRIEDTDVLRSTFIRNVSHEFRTPLGIIMGFTELLYEGDLGKLQPEQEQALSVVMRRVNQLQKTVERIVILLAVESSVQAPFPVNMAEVAHKVVENQRARALQSGLDLKISTGPNLELVSGDPGQLEQVVESLVENAIKFTPRGGKVDVKVYAKGDKVCLAVSDTGIGISDPEQERIFSGFYQVDGSTARKYGGLGLGLTLARAVVEAHGGRIELESQAGKGSRFLVKLPARDALLAWNQPPSKWQH